MNFSKNGVPASWPINVYIDGKMVFFTVSSDAEQDELSKGIFKIGNIYLKTGKHTIRFERWGFPGRLPKSWALKPAEIRPEACIRALISDEENVFRVGKKLNIKIKGGTREPTAYELFLTNQETGKKETVGKINFEKTNKPVEKNIQLQVTSQGVFQLTAESDGKALKPADLCALPIIAVDMAKKPKPGPKKLDLKLVADIDCVKNTVNGRPVKLGDGFWEKYGQSRIVKSSLGEYRETSGQGYESQWAMDAFSYKIDLPDTEHIYKLEVDYPDDDRRTMGFWINDFAYKTPASICTGGVEAGDHYKLSHKMLTYESFFYPQKAEGLVVAVINLMINKRAAASKIRIYQVDSALPAGPGNKPGNRHYGFYFEEPGRWLKFFGGESKSANQHLNALERWGQWNRYIGANVMYPTIHIYGNNVYPSRLVSVAKIFPTDYCRLNALVAEKYNSIYVPEFHLGGSDKRFNRDKLGFWITKNITDYNPNAKRIRDKLKEKVEFHHTGTKPPDELLYHRDSIKFPLLKGQFLYNALHPNIQKQVISTFGELADRLKDIKSFDGISSRIMFWQMGAWTFLPGIEWGYGDWTVKQFEKDTGIRVPVAGDAPDRFKKRYRVLTSKKFKEKWLSWRCRKIFDYHKRLRDRIQKAKPAAKLYLTLHIKADPMDSSFSEKLKELVGMDLELYRNEAGIVIIPVYHYGRRRSALKDRERPEEDARIIENLLNPEVLSVGNTGERGFCIYTTYFEPTGFTWKELGGSGNKGFDACIPADFHEREMYAIPLAESDISLFINGGNGWLFGNAWILWPFMKEYKALPAIHFNKVKVQQDPVAVWWGKHNGKTYFYIVNRLPYPVSVKLETQGAKSILSASSKQRIQLQNGKFISVKLEPFMMKSFVSQAENVQINSCQVKVPDEFKNRLSKIIDFARELKNDIENGNVNKVIWSDIGKRNKKIVKNMSKAEQDRVVQLLNESMKAYQEGRYWRALVNLERRPLIRVYDANDKWPSGLHERKSLKNGK